jgi:AAHS family 4-hydroxybenzoate transporter-like MFS transporter
MATKVDVIDLIDRHRVTGFQITVLILCMLVAALDGFDTQAIGYTAPAIAAQIHLPMPQFGQVGSAGLLGAAIGALSFGPLADVFGRKWFMILAMVVFAVFSYFTATSGSLNELLAYRFCAGLGLGGVTPAFLAMGAELAPKRLRSVFVTVLFASFPFGGLLGSLLASWVIPAFGWQTLFYIGAVAPLVIAVILAVYLPESIRYLLARNIGYDEVRRTLERIMPGAVPADAELTAPPDPAREGVPVTHLFTEGRAVPTVLLWVPFFMVFMVLVTVTFWTPAVLNSVGFSLSSAALIIGLNNRQRDVGLAGASRRRILGADPRLHYRRALPGLVRTSDVVGADAGGGFVPRRGLRGRHRYRIARGRGRHVSDIDPLDRHRLGHGHGPRRPGVRSGPDRLSGGGGLQGRRHLLRRSGPVLYRRAVPDLPADGAAGAGCRCAG